MSLNGYSEETHGYNTLNKNGELPNANYIKAVQVPIGAIIPWVKTFYKVTDGTADGTSSNKLINSGDTFITDGVKKSMIVLNTTDSTETYITNVDSETQLSLNDDIFVSGENYEVYATPYLPDGFVECDGSVINDSDSPFYGQNTPNLNDGKLIYGGTSSGGTKTEDYLPNHTHDQGSLKFKTTDSYDSVTDTTTGGAFIGAISGSTGSAGEGTAWTAYQAVWIMRIK